MTDYYGNSRWDMQPPPPKLDTMPDYGFTGSVAFANPNTATYGYSPLESSCNFPPVYHNMLPTSGFGQYADALALQQPNQDSLRFHTMPPPPKRQAARNMPDLPKPAGLTDNMDIGDVYIPDIVEERATDSEKSKHITENPATQSRKRKAAEISVEPMKDNTEALSSTDGGLPTIGDDELLGIIHQAQLPTNHDANLQQVPAPKRRKRATPTSRKARKAVGEFAKYAGVSVLGSVATMAFLCSPLAEKTLEWLA